MKRLVLTWDSPHTFTIRRNGRVLTGTLTIRKPKGIQRIQVRFPRGVTLVMIRDAWEKQRRRWRTVTSPPTGPHLFFAVRAIVLPKHQIVWYVVHADNRPFDACVVHAGKRLPTWK